MRIFPALIFSLVIFAQPAYAQVVINEFSASSDIEWIELFNTGGEVSLDGWRLRDGNSSESDDITLSGTIQSNGYLVFEHSKGWLNDGGDTITLYDSSTPSAAVDTHTYTSSSPNYSSSRIPDGSGSFVQNTNPTPGSKNESPPSPSPSPSSSPAPSPSSKPSPSPSAPSPLSSPSSLPTPLPSKIASIEEVTDEGEVKGVSESASINLDIFKVEPVEKNEEENNSSEIEKSKSKSSAMIAGSGLALLLAGVSHEVKRRRTHI